MPLTFVQIVGATGGHLTVLASDGRTYTVTGTRNNRNNNPGNIAADSHIAHQYGAIGGDGNFNGHTPMAVFPTLAAGQAAQRASVLGHYGGSTILDMARLYAPDGPPDYNDSTAYARTLANAAGVPVSTIINDLTPAQRTAMLSAQTRLEGADPQVIRDHQGNVVQFPPGDIPNVPGPLKNASGGPDDRALPPLPRPNPLDPRNMAAQPGPPGTTARLTAAPLQTIFKQAGGLGPTDRGELNAAARPGSTVQGLANLDALALQRGQTTADTIDGVKMAAWADGLTPPQEFQKQIAAQVPYGGSAPGESIGQGFTPPLPRLPPPVPQAATGLTIPSRRDIPQTPGPAGGAYSPPAIHPATVGDQAANIRAILNGMPTVAGDSQTNPVTLPPIPTSPLSPPQVGGLSPTARDEVEQAAYLAAINGNQRYVQSVPVDANGQPIAGAPPALPPALPSVPTGPGIGAQSQPYSPPSLPQAYGPGVPTVGQPALPVPGAPPALPGYIDARPYLLGQSSGPDISQQPFVSLPPTGNNYVTPAAAPPQLPQTPFSPPPIPMDRYHLTPTEAVHAISVMLPGLKLNPNGATPQELQQLADAMPVLEGGTRQQAVDYLQSTGLINIIGKMIPSHPTNGGDRNWYGMGGIGNAPSIAPNDFMGLSNIMGSEQAAYALNYANTAPRRDVLPSDGVQSLPSPSVPQSYGPAGGYYSPPSLPSPPTVSVPQSYGPAGQNLAAPSNSSHQVTGASVPQTAGPAGQSYQSLPPPSVPQSYGPAGGYYSPPLNSGSSSAAMNDPTYKTVNVPSSGGPQYITTTTGRLIPAPNVTMNVSGSPDDRDSPDGIARAVPGLTSPVFQPTTVTRLNPNYVPAHTIQVPLPRPDPRYVVPVPKPLPPIPPSGYFPAMPVPFGASWLQPHPLAAALGGLFNGSGLFGPMYTPDQIKAFATPQVLANQNSLAAAALKAGQSNYSAANGAMIPLFAANGQPRNSYGDASAGVGGNLAGTTGFSN